MMLVDEKSDLRYKEIKVNYALSFSSIQIIQII